MAQIVPAANHHAAGRGACLGGAPNAGSSSVARLLGERLALDVVDVDDSIEGCVARLDQVWQTALSRWMALSWDERRARPPEVLLSEVVACYREHVGFVREQLRTLDRGGRTVLVEGSAILPADVAPTFGSARFAEMLVGEVRDLGLACITVDGSESSEEIADVLAEHFGLVRGGEPGDGWGAPSAARRAFGPDVERWAIW
jgi:hypothetical protein